MKKFLTFSLAGALLFLVSCNSKEKGAISDQGKKNLASIDSVTKMIATGDFSKIGDYIAVDAVDHAAENGPAKGLEAIKADLTKASQSMEMTSEIIKEFADDEYAMSLRKTSGKMKVDHMGMKAGDTFSALGIEVVKFKDGKAIEHWTFVDPAEMMKMMGGMPPATSDTTKPK